MLRVGGLDSDLQSVRKFIESQLSGSTLKEQHGNLLQYQLPSAYTSLTHIFSLLAHNKEQLKIEDYSVSQTTLDQVRAQTLHHCSQLLIKCGHTHLVTPVAE